MKLIHGPYLDYLQREEVLRSFVHRATIENGHFALKILGIKPTETDKHWLLKHAFWIRNDGGLSRRHHSCESVTKEQILLHILKTTGV